MKNIILSIFLAVGFFSDAQAQLNDYKYIIVPIRFDGFKNDNQYKTSTLVKHLFTEKGFNTVYEDHLPEDLASDRCLGLFVGLLNESSMFTTKTALVLKDCNDKETFTTVQGRSKQKAYEASFEEAIRNAFNSFNSMEYNYTPKKEEPVTVSFKNDVKKLEEERPNLRKNQDRMVKQIATEEEQYYKDNRPTKSNYKKADASEVKKEVVEQVATPEEQSFKTMEPEPTDFKKGEADIAKSSSVMKTTMGVLYAQELSNGYQLVDSTPKIRMRLFKSSSPNVYIAKAGTINGVVYSEAGKWIFEYYNANELMTEELNIRF